MYLTAFLHREKLFEITNRWLSNRLEPEDPIILTKIITYDSFAAWEMLLFFMTTLLETIVGTPVHRKKISDKKEFKDFICNANISNSNRVRALISKYRNMSEFFYVGSPFAGYIYHTHSSPIIGISRFKRVKRIAEKASRYASMYLHNQVQIKGEEIAKQKATSEDHYIDQISYELLLKAEEQVMKRIRKQGLSLPVHPMAIKDILGIKVIRNGIGESALESAISDYPGAQIVEKETHTGRYSAVHYVVEIKANFEYIVNRFRDNENCIDYRMRGLPKKGLQKDFIEFMKTGAETLQIDVISTTYEELIESEIGRSMHETRIFKQRQQQNYLGNLPINVEYIIEYLFAVGLSPAVRIDDIPIKIWGRYLPDALSYRIRKLYNMSEYCLVET